MGMPFLHKWVYEFNAIPVRITMVFLVTGQKLLTRRWKNEYVRMSKIFLKKECVEREGFYSPDIKAV